MPHGLVILVGETRVAVGSPQRPCVNFEQTVTIRYEMFNICTIPHCFLNFQAQTLLDIMLHFTGNKEEH